jgi:hypothetical protein
LPEIEKRYLCLRGFCFFSIILSIAIVFTFIIVLFL